MKKPLPNLTPDDVRLEALPNGKRPVVWQLVDPWVRRCTENGDIVRLATHLGITPGLLRQRKRRLGMEPLPAGRPREEDLTEAQKNLLRKMDSGMTVTEIANEKGTTPQSVINMRRRLGDKRAIWDRLCKKCEGKGVRPCGSDGETRCAGIGGHSHICIYCNGEGLNS